MSAVSNPPEQPDANRPAASVVGERVALLPCPFCGAQPRVTERPNMASEPQRFSCFISCCCGGYSANAWRRGVGGTAEDAQAAAINAWNTRAPPSGSGPETTST